MPWRLYERRGSPYTCFCCCHVRAGTLMLGFACLILKVISIVVTFVTTPHQQTNGYGVDLTTPKQGLNVFRNEGGLGSIGTTTVNSSLLANSNVHHGDNRAIELVLNIGAALFTVCLLYGVIKGRAKFLLPYFCLQVFDFCFSALVIIGFFTYDPNIKPWLASQQWFPLRDQMMTLGTGWLVLIAGCAAICILWIKAYFISVVWSCYKYLICLRSTLPVHGAAFVIESDSYNQLQYPEDGALTSSRHDTASPDSDVSIMLPPKYEDVLQMREPTASECSASSSSLPPAYNEVVCSDTAHRNH